MSEDDARVDLHFDKFLIDLWVEVFKEIIEDFEIAEEAEHKVRIVVDG